MATPTKCARLIIGSGIAVRLVFVAVSVHGQPPDPQQWFDANVAPIFVERCLDCHQGREPKGELNLSSHQEMLRGGESGAVVIPGAPLRSRLWQLVNQEEMPPEHPLHESQKAIIREWITDGAHWGTDPIDPFRVTTGNRAGYDWWALQPLRDPPIPVVANAHRVRNPIDAFVLHRLEADGLTLSPDATPRTLVRRLHFALTGLPPSPASVQQFVGHVTETRYQTLVEQLLSSVHFGERWARHWLDVARFGESQGFERNRMRTHAWRYRDWVIRALNDDMPYDQFARMQIAGDCIHPDQPAGIVPTGFLVAGPWDEVGQSQQSNVMKAVVQADEMEDYVGTVCQTFLGLTVNCARCHDHKFDPISQREYYQIAAALDGVSVGDRDITPPDIATAAAEARSDIDRQLAELADQLRAIDNRVRKRLELPTSDSEKSATPADADPQVRQNQSPTERSQWDALTARVIRLRELRARHDPLKSYAVTAVEPAMPMTVQLRGNPSIRGDVVTAAGIASLSGLSPSFGLSPDSGQAQRRSKLAAWITDPRNPLFARVIVNRIWHYHFGIGIVASPNDFGFNGGRPSHPELLDYLATRLIEADWRLKPIHQLIVSSSTWRQSTRHQAAAAAIDGDNRLLWRKNRMRLEAEVVRDAILDVAGQLNTQVGGPPYRDFRTFNFNTQFYEMIDPVGAQFNRRTIYRMWLRGGRNSLLDAFDCPEPSATTPRRAVTTTPTQSLSLLNNSFVLRMCDQFADRVRMDVGDASQAQISRVFQLAYGRPPSHDERLVSRDFVADHGLAAFCRVVINSNEFVYVD